MNLNIHNEIFDRVKRAWDFLIPAGSSPQKVKPQADLIIKMNLPPLMGRRDAAYDRIGELISGDVFALDIKERNKIYQELYLLLRLAGDDTKSIILMLSSPDTQSREKKFLTYILVLISIAQMLGSCGDVENNFLNKDDLLPADYAVEFSDNELARNEKILSESQINMVNLLRTYFDRSNAKVLRYREYANKSFSKSNLARYHKAYESYSKIYTGDFSNNML